MKRNYHLILSVILLSNVSCSYAMNSSNSSALEANDTYDSLDKNSIDNTLLMLINRSNSQNAAIAMLQNQMAAQANNDNAAPVNSHFCHALSQENSSKIARLEEKFTILTEKFAMQNTLQRLILRANHQDQIIAELKSQAVLHENFKQDTVSKMDNAEAIIQSLGNKVYRQEKALKKIEDRFNEQSYADRNDITVLLSSMTAGIESLNTRFNRAQNEANKRAEEANTIKKRIAEQTQELIAMKETLDNNEAFSQKAKQAFSATVVLFKDHIKQLKNITTILDSNIDKMNNHENMFDDLAINFAIVKNDLEARIHRMQNIYDNKNIPSQLELSINEELKNKSPLFFDSNFDFSQIDYQCFVENECSMPDASSSSTDLTNSTKTISGHKRSRESSVYGAAIEE